MRRRDLEGIKGDYSSEKLHCPACRAAERSREMSPKRFLHQKDVYVYCLDLFRVYTVPSKHVPNAKLLVNSGIPRRIGKQFKAFN